jgi:methyltransferase-like protein/trans-aconitate methyltransferase
MDILTNLTDKIGQSYEALPYYSRAFPETHPAHLATIGRLFGMNPAPVSHCRVLELGCASGGNLIPIATNFPNSEFIGIDLSPKQIEEGNAFLQELSLTNVQLVADSLSRIDESWGQFDYIIAHGIYSWVPEPIRDKILAICQDNLTPQGIAYISYNTYPGWHLRGIVRDLLIYATATENSPQAQLKAAKTLSSQLTAISCQGNSERQKAYNLLLHDELQRLENKHDSYLFHEYLESINVPFYFHEFIAQAQAYQLQYLGEAFFSRMFDYDLSSQAQKTLQEIAPDLITGEQYVDILRNQAFRQTLLCHEKVKLDRCLKADCLEEMSIYSSAEPIGNSVNMNDESEVEFKTETGAILRSSNPVTKVALSSLRASYPEMIPFSQLWDQVKNELGNIDGRKQLALDLIRGFSVNLVTLSCEHLPCQKKVSAYPVGWNISREQAKFQRRVTNIHHEMVTLTASAQQILPYLDGTSNVATLAQKLSLSPQTVEETLTELAKLGVLVG